MSDTLMLMVLILFIVACEACAQSCANNMSHTPNIMFLIAGGLFYMLVVYLLSLAHKKAPMGIVNAIWSGLSVIAISSVGYFIFDQKLANDQIAMMGVIAIGVAYLAVNMEPEPG